MSWKLFILAVVLVAESFASTIPDPCTQGITHAGQYSACLTGDPLGTGATVLVIDGPKGVEVFGFPWQLPFGNDLGMFLNPFGQVAGAASDLDGDVIAYFGIYTGTQDSGSCLTNLSCGGFPPPVSVNQPGMRVQGNFGGLGWPQGIPACPSTCPQRPIITGISNQGIVSGTIVYSSGTFDYYLPAIWDLGRPQPVEEPSSALLLVSGLLGAEALLRKRAKYRQRGASSFRVASPAA